MSRPLLPALLGLAVIGAGLLFALGRPSAAGPDDGHAIAFLYVTGEGPSAKAWFRGAPPTGESVQDALDRFAAQGYRVANVTASDRPSMISLLTSELSVRDYSLVEQAYVILLER